MGTPMPPAPSRRRNLITGINPDDPPIVGNGFPQPGTTLCNAFWGAVDGLITTRIKREGARFQKRLRLEYAVNQQSTLGKQLSNTQASLADTRGRLVVVTERNAVLAMELQDLQGELVKRGTVMSAEGRTKFP